MTPELQTAANSAILAGARRKPTVDDLAEMIGGYDDLSDVKGHAAGIVFVAPDGEVLLLRRSSTEENYAGHWALPGGKADDGETPEQAADREAHEELGGMAPKGEKRLLSSVRTLNGMAFHTFAQHAPEKFVPKLNNEHSGYAWASRDMLPEPLHPQVKKTLATSLAGDAEFNEGDHPRDKGKFAPAGGGGSSSDPPGYSSAMSGKSIDELKFLSSRAMEILSNPKSGKKSRKEAHEIGQKVLAEIGRRKSASDEWKGLATALDEFNESDHPRVSNGEFGSGGGGKSSTGSAKPGAQAAGPKRSLTEKIKTHAETIKKHGKETADWIKQEGAGKILATIAKDHRTQAALSFALQSLVSHGTGILSHATHGAIPNVQGLDPSTWHLNEAIVEHALHDYATAAAVSAAQAKATMREGVKALLKYREHVASVSKKPIAGDAETDGVTEVLNALLDILGEDEDDTDSGAADEFNEGDHPRGQPGNAGQFGSGGGGGSEGEKSSAPAGTAPALSDKEKTTLARYGEGHSYNVNRYLRDPKAAKAEAKKNFGARAGEYIKGLETASKTIDAVIAKSKLQKDTDLFRGVSDFAHVRDAVANLKPGETFTLPTFSSTSRSKEWATDFMSGKSGDKGMMVINAKAGSNALDMDQFARHGSEEQEMLIGRNQPLVFDRFDPETRTVYLTLAPAKSSGATDSAPTLALDRDSVREIDADGRLHVAVTNISKATVNPYRGHEIPDYEKLGLDPQKIYQLLRDPEELKKAVPTLNGVQVLRKHIPVSAEDHQPWDTVGATLNNAEFVEPYLRNSIVVWAKDDIDAIKSGAKKELSMGYRYTPVMEPGTFQGMPYDGVMRDIVVNHVAIVEDGRAGPDVVVGDSNDEMAWVAIEEAIASIA